MLRDDEAFVFARRNVTKAAIAANAPYPMRAKQRKQGDHLENRCCGPQATETSAATLFRRT
jgi:hypothetical protein